MALIVETMPSSRSIVHPRQRGTSAPLRVTAPEQPPSLLDMVVLDELRALTNTTPHVFASILEGFIADSERRLQRIAHAGARDLERVHFEAHALKGAGGAVGALEVTRIANTLERYARVRLWSDELLVQLRAALEQTSAQLRELLARPR